MISTSTAQVLPLRLTQLQAVCYCFFSFAASALDHLLINPRNGKIKGLMTHLSPHSEPLNAGALTGPGLFPVGPPARPGGHRRPQEAEGAAGCRPGRLEPQGWRVCSMELASHTEEHIHCQTFFLPSEIKQQGLHRGKDISSHLKSSAKQKFWLIKHTKNLTIGSKERIKTTLKLFFSLEQGLTRHRPTWPPKLTCLIFADQCRHFSSSFFL